MSQILSCRLREKYNLYYRRPLNLENLSAYQVILAKNKLTHAKLKNTVDNKVGSISGKDIEQKPFASAHLLLIEDNPIASRLVEIIISKMGHHLTSVESGEQAMKLTRQTPFDIIITNINLPGISGIKVCQQIRALDCSHQNKKIPIIGLTTCITDKEKQACLQAGMNDVFVKPLNLTTIQAIFAKFLPKAADQTELSANLIRAKQSQYYSQFLELIDFPTLDPTVGINNTGSEVFLRELTMLFNEELALDQQSIYDAYKNNDQKRVVELAHKMRSSAIYCGAIKLHKACQYTEDSLKIDNPKLFSKLCLQLLDIIKETKLAIANYLIV
ncbi:response regulator [Legionella sp. CNM-1927-20]|uniref:response regulator n=1 Tax=Legionella sp. CNM-1927-20 TaxID=3422221 RepID=UPI00403AE825